MMMPQMGGPKQMGGPVPPVVKKTSIAPTKVTSPTPMKGSNPPIAKKSTFGKYLLLFSPFGDNMLYFRKLMHPIFLDAVGFLWKVFPTND
jgi:hypothetical protein